MVNRFDSNTQGHDGNNPKLRKLCNTPSEQALLSGQSPWKASPVWVHVDELHSICKMIRKEGLLCSCVSANTKVWAPGVKTIDVRWLTERMRSQDQIVLNIRKWPHDFLFHWTITIEPNLCERKDTGNHKVIVLRMFGKNVPQHCGITGYSGSLTERIALVTVCGDWMDYVHRNKLPARQ